MTRFDKINPDIKVSPLMVALTMVAPQLLLVLFRSCTLSLIHTEIRDSAALIYANYLAVPLTLSGLALALLFWSKRSGDDLPRWSMLCMFLLQTASLVFYLLNLQHLLPRGIEDWIVPAGPFVMLQLAAAMPGLFYSLLCFANVRFFRRAWVNLSSSFGVLVAVPASLYLIMIASRHFMRLPDAFVIATFVIATLITAFTFLQLLLWLSGHLNLSWIPTALFALVLPICGLLLNRAIPFPADLQHWGFYTLAIANAAVLLWGCHTSAANQRVCAWATAFSYPFTCYFFFLFLPFLPFSLIAMIAVGSGFLILTPTVLFILHTRQLVSMFKIQSERYGKVRVAIGFLVAFLLVPSCYVGRALFHRHIFHQTLDRVYASPIENPSPMPSPRTASYALKQLYASKQGRYVPILSEVYNRIVFRGMVLPDKKMEQLDQLLLGGELGAVNSRTEFSFYSLFTDEQRRTDGRHVRPPSRNVSLTDTACTAQTDDGTIEATVLLTLHNNSKQQAEYVTHIEIPDGVFVSGFEMKIGNEWVPARLSDRRAAVWVYHMIRDRARHDPGLVVYTGPNTVRLNVFPLPGNAERQCALKLLYPQNMAPEIQIDEREIALPCGEPASVVIRTPSGRQALYLPLQNVQQMNGLIRSQEKTLLSGTKETAGYCPEWDVEKSLMEYWNSGDRQIRTVPLFVTSTEQPLVEFDRAAYWLPLIPDGGWLNSGESSPEPVEVLPFQCGEQVRVVSKKDGGWILFNSSNPIKYFDAVENKTVPFTPVVRLDADSRYALAVDLWQAWWETQLHPETEDTERSELLLAARKLNILIPPTAFITVESTAQKKALESAEAKSLKSHKSLAFDEYNEEEMNSPEPSLLLLTLIVFPLLYWMQRKKLGFEPIWSRG